MRTFAAALVGLAVFAVTLVAASSGATSATATTPLPAHPEALEGRAEHRRLTPTPGDANCDASLTSADALAVLRHVAALGPDAPCLPDADLDCDGDSDAVDALNILRLIAALPVDDHGCASPSPHPTPTATPLASASPAHTHTPALSPTGAPTLTPTPTAIPTANPSLTPTPTPTSTATPTANPQSPTLTPGPSSTPHYGELSCNIFPPDNWWNTDISNFPVHPLSNTYVDSIGRNTLLHPDFGTVWAGKPIGIPYVVVNGSQPKVPVSFFYDSESDPGPYPIPPAVPVEGQPVGQPNTANFGGDRHVIVVDDENCVLYETFDSWPINAGQSWDAGSGAVFDLNSNALRPDTWTSADAAGLPIFAGLVRYEEVVVQGHIDHALRFTVSQTQRAFIHPATHYASSSTDPSLPPMGLRFRMKAGYDCSWARSEVQVICDALKRYGMFVADNGADWYISGAPDPRWDDDRLGDLKDIPGDAFEAVDTGEPLITP